MASGKDFEMSPFEAARKLLSMEAQHLSLGAQSDLIFQDMDLVPLLIQENYLNHRPVIATNDQLRMQVLLHQALLLLACSLICVAAACFVFWLMRLAAAQALLAVTQLQHAHLSCHFVS